MVKTLTLAGGVFGALFALFLLPRGTAQQDTQAASVDADPEHGRYLVHQVCLCVVCHSPRDAAGKPIETGLLTGGTIPLESPYPGTDWAFRAPKIAGLPAGWTEEEFVHSVMTRSAPGGLTVRLPMPPFHLNERDARSIAAYLKSLR